jgi:type IV pilus assembly protein PilM
VTERHIGLDIGSFAIRAAEVTVEDGAAVLHRFAQLTLPARSVVEGEVVDPAAVANAIRELWIKGSFKSNKVVVGISSPRVKVRQAEVPDLDPADVRAALRYEAQDLIPLSEEDAVVDFLVQDRFQRDGNDMLRVLVGAAPRSDIDRTLAAVTDAGLEVEAVDLVPFALVRALAGRPGTTAPGEGEIIVSVGAGLTSVVVQVDGIPQLMRTTPGGGTTITEALAGHLSLTYEQAEAIKRTASRSTADGRTAVALIEDELDATVREIVGSVDYFLAQTPDTDVHRIVLTGAGAQVRGLRERIAHESNLEVVPADALRNVVIGKTDLTPEQLVAASTTMAGPIGLAMAPAMPEATRLAALLPASYVQRMARRRETKFALIAVACLALVLLAVWGQRSITLRSARADVSRVQHRERLLASRDARYGPFGTAESDLIRRTAIVRASLASDTDAAALLDQISAALPPDVWIQSVAIVTAGAKAGGSASFTLGGVDGSSPAHWLTKMRALDGVFTQVSLQGLSGDTTGRSGVRFTSQAVLASGFGSHRADQFGLPK